MVDKTEQSDRTPNPNEKSEICYCSALPKVPASVYPAIRDCVSGDEHVEFAKSVSDGPTVKARNDLARIGVDVIDIADIAVIDLLVIVVFDLHDLVAGRECQHGIATRQGIVAAI